MPDDAILEMLRGLRTDLGAVQHDVSMMRGELSEMREAQNGIRDARARDEVWVQRHIEEMRGGIAEVRRAVADLRQMSDDRDDREYKAAAFAKGREAERYRYVQFARRAGAVVSHRAFLIVVASLAALGVSVINAVRWWGW